MTRKNWLRTLGLVLVSLFIMPAYGKMFPERVPVWLATDIGPVLIPFRCLRNGDRFWLEKVEGDPSQAIGNVLYDDTGLAGIQVQTKPLRRIT